MKHLKRFSSINLRNQYFIRPVIALVTSNSSVVFKSSEPQLLTTLTGTISSVKTGTYTGNGKTYQKSYNMFINLGSTAISGYSAIGISINDGEIIGGSFSRTVNQGGYTYSFTSDKLYIYDYLKEPSGQGAPSTQTQNLYTTSDISLTNGQTVTIKIYAW